MFFENRFYGVRAHYVVSNNDIEGRYEKTGVDIL